MSSSRPSWPSRISALRARPRVMPSVGARRCSRSGVPAGSRPSSSAASTASWISPSLAVRRTRVVRFVAMGTNRGRPGLCPIAVRRAPEVKDC